MFDKIQMILTMKTSISNNRISRLKKKSGHYKTTWRKLKRRRKKNFMLLKKVIRKTIIQVETKTYTPEKQ